MTGVKIVWTEPACQDLRDIFTCIAEDNPDAAQTPLTEIKERAVLLQDNPLLGRTGRIGGTRELVLAGTIYPAVSHKRTADSDFGGFSWRKVMAGKFSKLTLRHS